MIALLAPYHQPAETTAPIEDGRVYTYAEIGEALGCTGARVQQIEAEALRKLRRRSVSLWTLREFLEP